MEFLFTVYENIQLFMTKYRGYELIEGKFIDYDEFNNKMQVAQHISHKFINKNLDGIKRRTDIYLCTEDSKYITTTPNFRKLIDKHQKESIQLFFFTADEFSEYIKNALVDYKHLIIQNYRHIHFHIELNLGSMCAVHRILNKEETQHFCETAVTHGYNIPQILVDDPQIIWIGGEEGQLVEIRTVSESSGEALQYKIIVANASKTHRIQKLSKTKKKGKVAKKDEKKDKKVDEELPANDNEDYIDDYVENDHDEPDDEAYGSDE